MEGAAPGVVDVRDARARAHMHVALMVPADCFMEGWLNERCIRYHSHVSTVVVDDVRGWVGACVRACTRLCRIRVGVSIRGPGWVVHRAAAEGACRSGLGSRCGAVRVEEVGSFCRGRRHWTWIGLQSTVTIPLPSRSNRIPLCC
jgi:hypothetical protein